MKEIFLYSHGGSGNHGCEALVRTTAEIIGSDVKTVYSLAPDEDKKYGIDKILEVKKLRSGKTPFLKKALASAQIHLLKNNSYSEYLSIADLARNGKKRIGVAIGGDNYCYEGCSQYYFQNKMLVSKGVKTVLWGCSVEPDSIDKAMSDDLKSYSLITARETITYKALKKINPNTYLYPDPAFTLPKKELELPDELKGKKFVGLNLSPMALDYSANADAVRLNFKNLIKYILAETDYSVALIPHVVWDINDDRKAMKYLLDEFKETGRVVMIDDGTCEEIKGYISRCEMFMGARTHSTIAAYSSCVPVVVLGYSVKARGIAEDIFGTQENYVLPVQQITEEDEMIKSFKWLSDNKEKIKAHLISKMPGYIEKAYKAGEKVRELCR